VKKYKLWYMAYTTVKIFHKDLLISSSMPLLRMSVVTIHHSCPMYLNTGRGKMNPTFYSSPMRR